MLFGEILGGGKTREISRGTDALDEDIFLQRSDRLFSSRRSRYLAYTLMAQNRQKSMNATEYW
jgi:hypothetical protein